MAKVLLAESNKALSYFIKKCLVRAGHVVTTCHTAAEAEDYLATSPFDLLLINLDLPDKIGLQVADSVQKKYKNLRIMIINGFAVFSLHNRLRNGRAMSVVSKPVHLKGLVRSIDALFTIHHETA